ncbi:MAG: CBS domain-containing protein [Bellilinea sp.]|nr:CBS domain-containing protein [Bellilinea sp.]
MLKISRWMKKDVVSIPLNSTIRQAIQLFIDYRVGTLPVVDESNHLVGILRLQDVIDMGMPDFIHLVTDFDFLREFGAVENHRPDPQIFEKHIQDLVSEAVSVHEESGLFRTAALLHKHALRDLPVVDHEGRLVGIASHVDIGVALLSHWIS